MSLREELSKSEGGKMLRRRIERLEKKITGRKKLHVVVFPHDGPALENTLPKTLDEVKQRVAEKYGFNSFGELEKAYEVLIVVFHVTEVDLGPDGEIIEIEDERGSYTVHCYNVQ